MRGQMKLPMLWGSYFTVYGGQYVKRPKNMFGVKMAVEIREPFDVEVPVVDFRVPTVRQMQEGLFLTTKAVLARKQVYIGCMGGIGRTGLMMAALAKAFGVQDPLVYTRQQYYSHAVETFQQVDFIRDLDIPDEVTWAIRRAKLRHVLSVKKSLTI